MRILQLSTASLPDRSATGLKIYLSDTVLCTNPVCARCMCLTALQNNRFQHGNAPLSSCAPVMRHLDRPFCRQGGLHGALLHVSLLLVVLAGFTPHSVPHCSTCPLLPPWRSTATISVCSLVPFSAGQHFFSTCMQLFIQVSNLWPASTMHQWTTDSLHGGSYWTSEGGACNSIWTHGA